MNHKDVEARRLLRGLKLMELEESGIIREGGDGYRMDTIGVESWEDLMEEEDGSGDNR